MSNKQFDDRAEAMSAKTSGKKAEPPEPKASAAPLKAEAPAEAPAPLGDLTESRIAEVVARSAAALEPEEVGTKVAKAILAAREGLKAKV